MIVASGIHTYDSESGPRFIYSVELEPGIYVDIMVVFNSRLIYPMQNEDGSYVYGDGDKTYPEYEYDYEQAKQLVMQEILHSHSSQDVSV